METFLNFKFYADAFTGNTAARCFQLALSRHQELCLLVHLCDLNCVFLNQHRSVSAFTFQVQLCCYVHPEGPQFPINWKDTGTNSN